MTIQDMKDISGREKKVKLNRGGNSKPGLGSVMLLGLVILALAVSPSIIRSLGSHLSAESGRQESEAESTPAPDNGIAVFGDSIAAGMLGDSFTTEDRVKNGDTFETILARNGIERNYLFPVLSAAKPAHNLNQVVVGRSFRFEFEDSLLSRLEYEIDDDRTLVVTRGDSATPWQADVEETVYEVYEREVSGVIESSLYEAVMDIGSTPELALKLSEIYAWQIDFHNDTRKGDNFRIIYLEKVHPKGMRKVDNILAAAYNNDGKELFALRYTNRDSTVDYFDLEGESMRRKFLRSPFKYMPRISSGFTHRRFHPILKRYRPHLGIDYAAPKGTPVLALGDGKVIRRGWNGGFGNYIMIKHNGMYSTSYGHLSGYARGLNRGSRVEQGEVIGYVGSTGLSTGPHLDFRFYKNGTPVNPRTVDIPAGDPIDPAIMEQYRAYRDFMVARLQDIRIEDTSHPFSIARNPSRENEKSGSMLRISRNMGGE